MRGHRILALWISPLLSCASLETAKVPLCAPLESLPLLPDAECELGEFSAELSDRVVEHAGQALVRVEFDDGAKIHSVCVDPEAGYALWSARKDLARNLDAILALPPGPECAASKRLDLNRYDAKLAEIEHRQARCLQQTQATWKTEQHIFGHPGRVLGRDFEHCMEGEADSIVLDTLGSTRPLIFVKPEVPNPGGPRARVTQSRCARTAWSVKKRAECIQSEGWELLTPPR